jgi:hypothetical protein
MLSRAVRREGRIMAIRILAQTGRLQRLLDDLELETGRVPSTVTAAMLVLSDWYYASRKVICLQGVVEAQPLFAEGRAWVKHPVNTAPDCWVVQVCVHSRAGGRHVATSCY